jgi:hypothetical protein
VHRSQLEPKLLDMLADPVTQALMDADRVDLRELIAMLSEIGHRLRCLRDATEEEKNLL